MLPTKHVGTTVAALAKDYKHRRTAYRMGKALRDARLNPDQPPQWQVPVLQAVISKVIGEGTIEVSPHNPEMLIIHQAGLIITGTPRQFLNLTRQVMGGWCPMRNRPFHRKTCRHHRGRRR